MLYHIFTRCFTTYSNRILRKMTNVSIQSASRWRTGRNWTILDSLGAACFLEAVYLWLPNLVPWWRSLLDSSLTLRLNHFKLTSVFHIFLLALQLWCSSMTLHGSEAPELGRLQLVHTTTALVAMAATNTWNQFQQSAGFPQNIRSSSKPLSLVFKVLKDLSSKSLKSHLTF